MNDGIREVLPAIPVNDDGSLSGIEIFMLEQKRAIAAQILFAKKGYKDITAKRISNGWLVSAKAVPSRGGRKDSTNRMPVTERKE